MTINDLKNNIRELALTHEDVVAFHVGESFDIATSKSSEKYPAVWLELPINTTYVDGRKKEHTTSINVLNLAKLDDIDDQIRVTSNMESIADQLMGAINEKYGKIGISGISGLTLRNFSDDDLCGVRVDLTFTVGRECNYYNKFNTTI